MCSLQIFPSTFRLNQKKRRNSRILWGVINVVDNLYTRTMRDEACSTLPPVCESASEAAKHTK